MVWSVVQLVEWNIDRVTWLFASECGRRPLFEQINKKDASEDELLESYREKRIVGGDDAEVASAPW